MVKSINRKTVNGKTQRRQGLRHIGASPVSFILSLQVLSAVKV